MISEKEREALMRLTMCAREECAMCKYEKDCNFDFQCKLATKNMNILADALRTDRAVKDKPQMKEDGELEILTQTIEFPDTHQRFIFTRSIRADGDHLIIGDWEYKGKEDEPQTKRSE